MTTDIIFQASKQIKISCNSLEMTWVLDFPAHYTVQNPINVGKLSTSYVLKMKPEVIHKSPVAGGSFQVNLKFHLLPVTNH